MKISIIVAMASNRCIGLNNQMPWHLSADLKHFKKVTMGSPILMGRKTFESIGRPLPGRLNIVISRNLDYQALGCQVTHDMESAFKLAEQEAEEVFIIGGSALYEAALPLADTLYLTKIHQDFFGDTFFPEMAAEQWCELDREDVLNDDTVSFTYSFVKYKRIYQ
jgi:dihydrofolate reductase